MAVPTKWNRTTAPAGPPENRNLGRAQPSPGVTVKCGDRADPLDSYADEAASEELGALVLKDSTGEWREFLARLKAGRETAG